MKMMLTLVAVSLAGAAVAKTSEAQLRRDEKDAARLNAALAGLKPGRPIPCLPYRTDSSVQSYGNSTLLFRVSRKLVYRSDVRGSCRRVGNGSALVTRTVGSRLCSGDIARSVDLVAGVEDGSCALGDFVPYTR